MGSKNSKPSSTAAASTATLDNGNLLDKKIDPATVTPTAKQSVKEEEKAPTVKSAVKPEIDVKANNSSAKSSIPIVRESVSSIDEQRNPQDAIIVS